MSVRLLLVIGPLVVCDLDLFALRMDAKDDPPAQLNGGQGSVVYPDPPSFGFTDTATR